MAHAEDRSHSADHSRAALFVMTLLAAQGRRAEQSSAPAAVASTADAAPGPVPIGPGTPDQAVTAVRAGTDPAKASSLPLPTPNAPAAPLHGGKNPTSEASGAVAEGYEDIAECVMCWDAAADVLQQPCGHVCTCYGCAEVLADALCPMCRCEVVSIIVLQL